MGRVRNLPLIYDVEIVEKNAPTAITMRNYYDFFLLFSVFCWHKTWLHLQSCCRHCIRWLFDGLVSPLSCPENGLAFEIDSDVLEIAWGTSRDVALPQTTTNIQNTKPNTAHIICTAAIRRASSVGLTNTLYVANKATIPFKNDMPMPNITCVDQQQFALSRISLSWSCKRHNRRPQSNRFPCKSHAIDSLRKVSLQKKNVNKTAHCIPWSSVNCNILLMRWNRWCSASRFSV